MKRLTIPSVLTVVAIGGAVTVGAIASCGDDAPQECKVEGVCPTDGKVCMQPSNGALCCPICPLDGRCPDGCVLDFPPV